MNTATSNNGAEPKSPVLPAIAESPSFRKFLRELWWFFGIHRWKMVGLMCVVMFCSATTLLPPWFLGQVIEAIVDRKPASTIVRLTALMSIFLVACHWLRVTCKQKTADLRATISARAREQAIDQLLSQGLKDGRLVGNEVARLDTGLRDYAELHRMFQNEILFTLVSFLGCGTVFLTNAPGLLITTGVYVLIVVAILRWSLPRVRIAQSSVSVARESFSGIFANVVGNALSVRAGGAEEAMSLRVGSSVQELEKSEHARNRISSRQWIWFNCMSSLYLGVTLLQVGLAGLSGALSIALIVVAYSYVREIIRSLVGIMDISEEFVQNYVGFSRLLNLLSSADEVFERTEQIHSGWKEIAVSRLSHRYPGTNHDVLCDLNWVIRRGSRIGIHGISGSGKSTLVKILLGLIQPSKGSITIDGRDLSKVSRASLRAQMSVALQECEVLALTLRENITLCRDVDESFLKETVEACALGQVIQRLPAGLDTLVGEGGYRLSGGERQRVGLARAVLRQPSLLVIDEATSMLDGETERRFFEGLRHLLPNVTLLLISHHERGWAYVDETIELNLGRINLTPRQAAGEAVL